MFRKKQFRDTQIQVCKCGGIHMCFGNVSVHFEKQEFLEMAMKVEKAKNYVNQSIPQEVFEVSGEIH